MGIEANEEAMNMLKNTLGSIENRFREAYNKGYKDGLDEGKRQRTKEMSEFLINSGNVFQYVSSTSTSVPPDPCKNCANHPDNGGSGVCFCVLGAPKIMW